MITPGHKTVFDIPNNKFLEYMEEFNEYAYLSVPKSLYYAEGNDIRASFDLFEYYQRTGDKKQENFWLNQPGVKELNDKLSFFEA